jgi:cell division protein FtsB|tara:strand:+ start:98 stop:433 length:336 start_codon:yes stop_codon:yes gene_type:complete
MEIDVRMILTLGGMLASVVTAFVIVKTKLQAVIEQLSDIENRFRSMDKNNDSQEVTIQNHAQRLDVISGMLAPKEREARAREMASIIAEVNALRKEIDKLSNMHNGVHPPK